MGFKVGDRVVITDSCLKTIDGQERERLGTVLVVHKDLIRETRYDIKSTASGREINGIPEHNVE